MFAIKRNQVIVTALAAMIAVAGYLNFTENKTSQKAKTASTSITKDSDTYAILGDSGDVQPIADSAPEDLDMAVAEGTEGVDALTAQAENEIVPVENALSVGEANAGLAEDSDDGAAVFVNAGEQSVQYFVQAKLDREQSRSKQKDMLTDMLNNTSIESEQKTAAADSMLDLQKRIEKETAAEAMIEAKGFKEAYVRIDDETVDVVVDKAELSEAELAQIEDIVTRKTGFTGDKIRISPLKKAK